jgi:hypothetical protein
MDFSALMPQFVMDTFDILDDLGISIDSSGPPGGGSGNGSGSGSGPPLKPASPTEGLNMDPDDPSHTLSKSAPPEIQKYKKEIEDASRETGVPADRIAAVMWAESRGNPDDPSRNKDGNMDVGPMQISQSTYNQVQGSQGGPDLDVGDAAQNIRAGAWELRDKFMDNGHDWTRAHAAYRGMEDGQDFSYADAVEAFYQDLIHGRTLPDNGRW